MWILIIGIIYIIYLFIKNVIITNKETSKENNFKISNSINYANIYHKNKYLLTQKENNFYFYLKKALNNNDLTIFIKPRLIDIITPINDKDKNKIIQKHIDFVLCDNNTRIIACIELDDNTHNIGNRIKSDNFKNKLFNDLNIKLFRYKVGTDWNFNEILEYINNFNKQKQNIEENNN